MGEFTFSLHSNSEESSSPFSSLGGHAWISITTPDGYTSDFGLWASTHEHVLNCRQKHGWDNSGTAIRRGLELGLSSHKGTASTSWTISKQQFKDFQKHLKKHESYHVATNNCSTWAAKVTEAVTGEKISENLVVTPLRVKNEIKRINTEKQIAIHSKRIKTIQSKEKSTESDHKKMAQHTAKIKKLKQQLSAIQKDIKRANTYEVLMSTLPEGLLDKAHQRSVLKDSSTQGKQKKKHSLRASM